MARKTKAEAAATRESILDAAESVFMEKGVARASLEEIARNAGVTRGAIYWHFRNKQDILSAMLVRVRAPLAEMIDDAGGDNPLGNLRDVCVAALRKLAEDEHYFRVYYILFHRNESNLALEKHRELADESLAFVGRIFQAPDIGRQLRPGLSPSQAAYLLHTQMLGLFYDWLTLPERVPLADMAPVFVDAMFRGLFINPVPV
ncbi:MAG TPA: TetR family transcriptional regulator [Marinobacter sp.]|nr:TetR family transcriptional regulator [Marinobacter sp.]